MNTHDIELPPLPTPDADHYDNGTFAPVWKRGKMESYARAAIEADRKRRGEPVAWAMFADNGNIRIWARKHMPHPDCVPLYTAPQPAEPVSQHPDDAAVDAFAAEMKAKLKRAREEKGRGGWQDMSATVLSDMLREHVQKGDPVDVANLAMMLHQNGQGIASAEPVKVPSKDDIRRIMLKHGYTIKPGNDDLKPYVYAAARELIAFAQGRDK